MGVAPRLLQIAQIRQRNRKLALAAWKARPAVKKSRPRRCFRKSCSRPGARFWYHQRISACPEALRDDRPE